MKNLLLLTLTLSLSQATLGATYLITYYEATSFPVTNFFTDYTLAGTATFSIADSAVTPNNLVLFNDAEFQTFDANISTTLGSSQFVLGTQEFPDTQGILFDNSGIPLRFDNPNISFGNAGVAICNPHCNLGTLSKAVLRMWDDNNFDTVYLADGTLISESDAITLGKAYTKIIGGNWDFEDIGDLQNTSNQSLYVMSEVPIPAAAWLFGSALLGLGAIKRRKA